jgi:hypothetical protein
MSPAGDEAGTARLGPVNAIGSLTLAAQGALLEAPARRRAPCTQRAGNDEMRALRPEPKG